ncbi:MAG: EF-P lysine aminoacylase GenX [Deltaproteobacteria bacterium]|nr:EF-P lysine aminoacylase GenX [Deltaproteobacteria bacterium]
MSSANFSNRQNRLRQNRPILEARAKIIGAIRHYFEAQDFLEVETPIRIKAPAPELNIDTEPSGDHFLIASPELQMKQLVAAGYGKIFQITKCFRRGERGDRHLPEFTMLEWYETGGTMATLMDRCQGIIAAGAKAVAKWPLFSFGDLPVSLDGSWHCMEVQDAFETFAGWRPGANPNPFKFDMDLVDRVEPALPTDKPLFLCGYPASMASLARLDPASDARALRLELYAGGLELANGFEELTDPVAQRQRFEAEEAERREAGKPPYPLDEAFLSALSSGMPPCAGMAMGLDRLIMLFTDSKKISDVAPLS